MNCIICDKVFTGIENFKQHEASIKHRKKVDMHKMLTSDYKTDSNVVEMMQNLKTLSCDPCSKTFFNLLEFQNHCISEEHARMVLKKSSGPNSSNNEMPMSIDEVDSTHDDLREQISELTVEPNLPSDFSKCDICCNKFSGPEPYLQHIASAAHKKKALAATSTIQSNALPIVSNLECKMCGKVFSGPESHQQHLDSIKHKKKMGALYSKEVLPFTNSTCNICDEHFNDPESYQQHINSDNHKNKIMAISNVRNNQMGVLNCEVCDKQFSGPVSYEQHMTSEKHKKKVNAKCLLKQITDGNTATLSNPVSPDYCELCKMQFKDAASYQKHMSALHHIKKFVDVAVESKRKEIQNLFSPQEGSGRSEVISQACHKTSPQKENTCEKIANPAVLDDNLKKFSLDKLFNITIFHVDEKIDFDKNVNNFNCNEVNMVSEDDDDDQNDEIMYEECPSP